VPSGEGWIHEIKFDGYRVQLHIINEATRVLTRRGHDWTRRFKKIAVPAASAEPVTPNQHKNRHRIVERAAVSMASSGDSSLTILTTLIRRVGSERLSGGNLYVSRVVLSAR